MSRQTAFSVPAATEITVAESQWIAEAAERIAASNAHLVENMQDGACYCGGNGHRDVVYSPTLLRDAELLLGVTSERAERLLRAAEDATGGKIGF